MDKHQLKLEELVKLPVGDWVWVVSGDESWYAMKDQWPIVDYFARFPRILFYSEYGKTWVAYKNREEAEGAYDEQICKKTAEAVLREIEFCVRINTNAVEGAIDYKSFMECLDAKKKEYGIEEDE